MKLLLIEIILPHVNYIWMITFHNHHRLLPPPLVRRFGGRHLLWCQRGLKFTDGVYLRTSCVNFQFIK